MNDFTLIPFRLRSSDQKFVDVSQVKRGKKCGCTCPSCSTPLIARQGVINGWHFAHAYKGVADTTKRECEYSFWLSVILMARQVISRAQEIHLPSLTMYSENGTAIDVTKQRIVRVDEVFIEEHIGKLYADAILRIDEHIIALIFTTPKNCIDKYTQDIGDKDKIGVIKVSLDKADQWFFGGEINGEYTKSLEDKIINSISIKRWVYHPRIPIIKKEHGIESLFTHKFEGVEAEDELTGVKLTTY